MQPRPSPPTLSNFTCRTCNHRFNSNEDLTMHIDENHVVDTRRYCDLCDIRFSNHYVFASHQRETHIPNLKGYTCYTCGECFPTLSNLKSHIYQGHRKAPQNYQNKNYHLTGHRNKNHANNKSYPQNYNDIPEQHGRHPHKARGMHQDIRQHQHTGYSDSSSKFAIPTKNRFSALSGNSWQGRVIY